MKKNTKKVHPDGGWGWMVVIGSAVALMANVPFLQLFGLLYGTHLTKLGANSESAALVGSVMLFVLNFGGPITGSYIKRTSPRIAASTGCVCVSLGVLLSGMTTAIWQMLPTYGVLVGFGIGLIQSSSFVAVNSYFKLKRTRAVGISVAGSGMGQLLLPQLVTYLQNNYGFRGACIILAGVSLNGLIGCMLIQPAEWHLKEVYVEEGEKEQLIDTPYYTQLSEIPFIEKRRKTEPDLKKVENEAKKQNGFHSCKELHRKEFYEFLPSSGDNNVKHNEKTSPRRRNLFIRIIDNFGFRLLANIRLVNTIVGIALGQASLQNFSLFYPFFLRESVGFKSNHVANCMSSIAAADLVGRLTIPSIVDRFKISAKVTMIATSFWLIITRQFLATQTTLAALITASVLFGSGRSMFIVSQNIAISDTTSNLDEVPLAIGLGMMMKGLWVMPVTLFMGWIRDYTGSYVLCMYAQNVLLLILLATWIPEILFYRHRERKKNLENS